MIGIVMGKDQVNGFKYVQSSGGIDEYKMELNSLTVLLMEDHSAPVATFMVTYHVGSRNEAVGYTGSTHLLEHLMFKGSKKFNKKNGTAIWTMLQNVGARINATTWTDRTNYFELLPSEHLETAIAIEADRMRHAFLRDEDRQPEMTVVRNEFERGENDPFDVLDKNIWATAYQAHPYHHSTIGWRSDIENVSTERLKEFYDTYYWPNNATVTIIGDFEADKALKLVKKYFGRHKNSPKEIPEMYTTEPKQEGPRRLSIKRSGETGIVGIAHKSPPGLDEDTYSFQILSKILGGGKSSRLYRKIIDKGLATGLFMWDFPFKDNGLFITYVFMTPGTDHAEVEKIVLDEYDNIKENGISEEEIKRAKAQINSEMAFSRDGSYSIASALNEAIAIGEWKFYTTYNNKIAAVTVEDIKRVAITYLQEEQSTTGYFIPETQGSSEAGEPGPVKIHQPLNVRPENADPLLNSAGGLSRKSNKTEKPSSISKQIKTSRPIRGLQLKTLKTPVRDVVTLTGSILGGDQFSPADNAVVPDLTADMLDEGTTKHTKFEISEILESVGASLSFSSDKYRLRFSAHCLKQDVPLVIELLGEQLRYPVFNKNDLKNLKKRHIGSLKRANEDTRSRAGGKFSRILYPEGHPNYSMAIEDEIADVEKTTINDLKKFQKNYGLGNMTLVAVGDIDKSALEISLKKAFGDWKQSELAMPEKISKANDVSNIIEYVTMEDKTSVDMFFGVPIGIDRDHPDYYALMVGNYILGGNFSARLMQSIRDEKGLTYGIYSNISGVNNGSDGYWNVWGTFSPDLLKEGKEATIEQINLWVKNVTEEELTAKKETITGSFKVGLATTGGLAGQILTNVERGYPDTMLDEYPNIIKDLTLNQVNKAIKKYISPDMLVIVAAGSIDKNGNPLSK
ncbi:MAG: insulinase family protein [Candidatus Marinimicrobia bacterium]|nr:insulinase family protein [Candidatus Neomarinimicrobiota bacterium]